MPIMRNGHASSFIVDGRLATQMFQELKCLSLTAVSGVAASAIVAFVLMTVSDTNDYSLYWSVLVGFVVALAVYFVVRRMTYGFLNRNRCEKLRDVSAILTFLAVIPTVIALIRFYIYPEVDAEDIIVLSALLVFASMLVQAFFWKDAQNVGRMAFFHVAFLVISLILMNVASLLCFDSGNGIMLALGMVMAILPIVLMYDWRFTVSPVFIALLICSVIGTIVIALDDIWQLGRLLSFWVPTLFVFLIGTALKNSTLVYNGSRLF